MSTENLPGGTMSQELNRMLGSSSNLNGSKDNKNKRMHENQVSRRILQRKNAPQESISDDEGEQEMLVDDISDLEDMMINKKYEEVELH